MPVPRTALAMLVITLAAAGSAEGRSPRASFIRDFDGNGKADLLWQNPGQGVGGWLMDGTSIRAASLFPRPGGGDGPPPITGDFDGDGRTDLLWRSATDDRYDIRLMDGVYGKVEATVAAAGSGWEAVAIGDFDGDGRTDILWKNGAGDFRVGFMEGLATRAYATVAPARPEFSVALVADFDGDGRSDILWSASDGSAWLSTTVGAATATRKLIDGGSGWIPAFAGDFDGDGHADIVWRHPDGRHGAWSMADPLRPAYFSLVDAGTGWSVRFVRDLDGDGRSDLLWEHDDGSVAAWLMSGGAPKAYRVLLGARTGWTLAAADDYDGDGRDDLLWRDPAGAYGMWLMSGLDAKAYGAVLPPRSGWEAAVAFEGCDRRRSGAFTVLGPATAGTNGSATFYIERTPGACGGAYAVGFTTQFTPIPADGNATGYAPLGAGSVTFADGEPGYKAIPVATGSAPGTYTVALQSATGISFGSLPTTASGSRTATVESPAMAACGTRATYLVPARNAEQIVFGSFEAGSFPALKPGETVAAGFTYQPTPFSAATVSIAQVTNPTNGPPADIELALSTCPAVFPGSAAGRDTFCSVRLAYPQTAMTALYGSSQGGAPFCALAAGQVYFINMRNVARDDAIGTTPSCSNAGGCALRLQPQGLN